MDVLIFSGQSNMQGSTGEICNLPPRNGVYEYKYIADELVPLRSPVGEVIGENVLWASALGCGSMVPYFCNEYARIRGEVTAIHVAKGDSTIAQWQKGTERFEIAIDKIVKGIKKAESVAEIGKIYFVWLQGESDALKCTPYEEYLKLLIKFKNDLKEKFFFDKFAIIKVGYFAAYADWCKGTFEEKKKSDENIMKAQCAAEEIDKDFTLLTDVTVKLSVTEKYLNKKEHGPHYNNAGMEIIGTEAAKRLAELVNESKGEII